ncbi:MAG: stage II sporulation protein P [Syntrophomonadaceae bacterium]|nr:stage II sporulation protein P [Syntrophomonadaceae bacterium]MDD3890340.1 stage II sporulation protein P [Syntrophomonadaceae bacterium]MDD4549469.1 stage II sporulation protein P [Syntrophomonadaceae bacterium]
MQSINKRYIWIFFAVLISVMALAYIINVMSIPPASKPQVFVGDNNVNAGYVTITDAKGNVILQTGLPVYEKDEYISAENVHYVIISVSGSKAVAKEKQTHTSFQYRPVNKVLNPIAQNRTNSVPTQAAPRNVHVVIYHTHSDESYVPTSGTPSKPGKGDVYQVGSALKDSFDAAGISATHSLNNHGPHDINAYHRSRRTATQLLKERPDAAFDVHRDSAPLDSYATSINGLPSSRVMIVVGRSNPNIQTNLQFARNVKAKADDLYPGLMRGIFIGKGDYNQDLYPTSLLFEVGTEGNSLDAAERAIRYLSDSLISVLTR